MKLWIVVVIDRHVDPMIEAWTDPGAAVERCKFLALEAADPEDIEGSQIDGWLYHCSMGGEGDHAYVFESELMGRR